MTAVKAVLAGLLVVAAVVLQTALIARVQLPYGRPDLVLVVVVAIALVGGAGMGMSAGFAAGLLVDLLSDYPAGMLALVLCLAGFGCGLGRAAAKRGVLVPLLVVAAAAVGTRLGYAALLAIVGSPRLDWRVALAALPGSVTYDLVLAVFVVPVVAAMYRRLDPGAR